MYVWDHSALCVSMRNNKKCTFFMLTMIMPQWLYNVCFTLQHSLAVVIFAANMVVLLESKSECP